ncbi:MAG: hydroxyacid dehydrogenase [Spirochaetes bacterium]|nr:hydroxyacid dehydrogenase [Spirochaetota bacterium]
MKTSVFILSERPYQLVFGPSERKAIESQVSVKGVFHSREESLRHPDILREVEILFSGWGGPRIDEEFLEKAPKLKLVLHAAGSVRPIVSDAFWERGIRICSAYGANAIPVSEFTFAAVVFCLKQAFFFQRKVSKERRYQSDFPGPDVPGCYGTTVGIVSLGMVGRRVCQLLRNLEVRILAYDPFVRSEDAKSLGVDSLCSLEDLFRSSLVVSLHTPLLPETEGMIRYHHLCLLQKGAGFINTSRGAVVNEPELIRFLQERKDVQAVLDVTHPEPPIPESPLYDLPNVFLTPHLAGSLGGECRRMGQYMVEELSRYLKGEPLQWEITKERFLISA